MNKVYVDVVAEFRKDGQLVPIFFTWEDGRKYSISFWLLCYNYVITIRNIFNNFICINDVQIRKYHTYCNQHTKYFLLRQTAEPVLPDVSR